MSPQSPSNLTLFDPTLLDTAYFRSKREHHEQDLKLGMVNRYRCYPVLVQKLQSVYEYNEIDAKYFARRLRSQQNSFRDCDAVFSEVIVYAHYIPLLLAGAIMSLDRKEDEYDLRIVRDTGPDVFLEIFCIMPEFRKNVGGVSDVFTHTQTALCSVRQKLLAKLTKQKQMLAERENWAVIELNNQTIAGGFAVRSSLSDGLKMSFNAVTLKPVSTEYDWSQSVFDLPQTKQLHGVIDFDLGNYENRRYIINARVHGEHEGKPVIP